MKTYTKMMMFDKFEDRYKYLRLPGEVGIQTFGMERHLNQVFYNSLEWKRARDIVIVRDNACDLAFPTRSIYGHIRVHHMNPISAEDFLNENFTKMLDPECLVCVSLDTHNAIHYGTEKNLFISGFTERKKGDTILWQVS